MALDSSALPPRFSETLFDKYFSECGKKFTAEASALGVMPGAWPKTFYIVPLIGLIITCRFVDAICDSSGDLAAATYAGSDPFGNSYIVLIIND